jgi:hypothetical protein
VGSSAQIRAAIPQLEARIKDLEALPVESVNSYDDPKVSELKHALESTLNRIFGPDTIEYKNLTEPFSATHCDGRGCLDSFRGR